MSLIWKWVQKNNRSHSPLNHRIVKTIPFLSLFLCCATIMSVISEELVSEWTTGHISCPGRTDGTVRAIYWLEYSNIPMYNCTLLDRWHIKKNPHRLERGGEIWAKMPTWYCWAQQTGKEAAAGNEDKCGKKCRRGRSGGCCAGSSEPEKCLWCFWGMCTAQLHAFASRC